MHRPRTTGKINLERTGPEIFPITFPIDVVVTDDFRRSLESSGLSGAEFRAVIKHRIVELDWSEWDSTEPEPPEIPESGEPEDYILARPHSPRAAAAMPQLWELIASDDSTADIYYLRQTKNIALSPIGKAWFDSRYADYVSIRRRG